MKKLKSALLKMMIAASVLMYVHTCYAQTNNNATALDYGSYGAQMNRQQLNRGPGFKQGNLHLGKLRIHPSFHERLQYDDNIFKVSGTHRKMEGQDSVTTNTSRQTESKESDIMNIASPGVRLELPLGDRILKGKIKQLGLNWQSDFISYDDNASQNQDNHYVVGSVTLEVLKGYDLTLNHNFQHTNVGAGSETDQLHARDTNSFGIGLKMSQLIRSLKKLDIEISYQNFDQDYSETQLERANRNEDSYSISISYKLTPKITINFPQYTYSVINYDKNRPEIGINTDPLSDSHTNSLTGGISWKATAKTTGYFNIGYTNREYEKDEHQGYDTNASAVWNTSDVDSYIMVGGVTTRLPWNTLLDVNIYRQLREAEFTAKSNSYFSTGGNFTISKKYRKLFTDFTAGFFQTDFNGVNREDNIYTLAVNASYAVTKWSQIEAGYSYRDKDTNTDFDRESEQINTAYIGIGFGF
jgi:hypothetical protein